MRTPKPLEQFPQKYRPIFSDHGISTKHFVKDECVLRGQFRKYENQFSSPDYDEYVEEVRKVYVDLDSSVYSAAMRALLLEESFGVKGCHPGGGKNHLWRHGHRDFVRSEVGYEESFSFPKKRFLFHALRKLANDLHPGFRNLDPRTERFPYPFRHVTLAHVVTCYRMDEAYDVLCHAEKEGMGYLRFLDFLANWVTCHNEKYGEKYRLIDRNDHDLPIIVANLMDAKMKTSMRMPKSR